MKKRKIILFMTAFITMVILIISPLASVKAMGSKADILNTTVYLTARVQNKWWYAGNLQCKSATLETLGQTYTGTIAAGNWWGLAGNESCFIAFNSVPKPLAITPARITITYYTLAGDALVNKVTNDRLQTQQEDYFLEFTWYDDYVVLDDMILNDTATVPVINYDPTALPPLPQPGVVPSIVPSLP
jgi:hypothetical protein